MNTQNNNSDNYDSPWKEGMELYFKEFMEFFFPEIACEIAWDKGYEFLDKELQSVVRDAETGRRYADKLVKVWSIEEKEFHVMIHIEIQSDKDKDFPKRMYVYNYRIFDKSYLPVTSLAILADENPLWRPEGFQSEQWGCEINFKFPMVKLIDYNDKINDLLNGTNPFAIITAAHLKTKATKNNPQARYSWKWTITTALYKKGFSPKDILNLYRLIDWFMMLPENLTKRFTEELIEYEEDKKMPYVMSAERIGIEKGMLQGIEKGMLQGIEKGMLQGIEKGMLQGIEKGIEKGMLCDAREMVLESLNAKYKNNVPTDIRKQIQALNNRLLLKKLIRSAVQSENIEGFRKSMEELTKEESDS